MLCEVNEIVNETGHSFSPRSTYGSRTSTVGWQNADGSIGPYGVDYVITTLETAPTTRDDKRDLCLLRLHQLGERVKKADGTWGDFKFPARPHLRNLAGFRVLLLLPNTCEQMFVFDPGAGVLHGA